MSKKEADLPALATPNLAYLDPGAWPDYEFLDSGNLRKLERFGQYVLNRPEPQALWPPALPESEWQKAQATFATGAKSDKDREKGEWQMKKGMPQGWLIDYKGQTGAKFKLKVSLSSFRHVGVFPEQAPNWDFIAQQCGRLKKDGQGCQVLNLFAYTGGASLAAASAGAQVTHVDSIKHTVSWANENMQASGLEGIRWMVDDAARFAAREARRGRKYQGIILDPPAYGRGPDGEKWVLEEHLQPLLETCAQLLDPERGFVILNLYSLGYSPLIGANLGERILRPAIQNPKSAQTRFGELCVGGGQLPLGTYWQMAWGS